MAGILTLGTLRLTGVDEFGAQWITEKVTGLAAPGSTLTTTQKPRQRGSWSGQSYSKERPISITGVFKAPSEAIAQAAMDRLITAASLEDTRLTIESSGVTRWVLVKRSGEVLDDWATARSARWSVQLVATDPRKFAADLTASTNLPSTSGGLTIPYTIPYQITSTQVSGQVSLTNLGNVTGPVTLRIDGPCVGPSITHVGAGGLAQTLALSSLTLGIGEWLTVDMEGRTVLAQGQASRSQFITSRGWSGFEPGANTWSFTAASYNPGALLTVTASPTWG